MGFTNGSFCASNRSPPLEEASRAGRTNVIDLLTDLGYKKMEIRAQVLKAAESNQQKGKEVMSLLLDRRGDQVQIAEDVAKAAAGNEDIRELHSHTASSSFFTSINTIVIAHMLPHPITSQAFS